MRRIGNLKFTELTVFNSLSYLPRYLISLQNLLIRLDSINKNNFTATALAAKLPCKQLSLIGLYPMNNWPPSYTLWFTTLLGSWTSQTQAAVFLVLVACSITACNVRSQYKNAAEFEATVQSWHLDGKPESDVTAILEKNGFLCTEHRCNLDVSGFPCLQRQRIFLVVNSDGRVTHTVVEKMPNGQLPSVCL